MSFRDHLMDAINLIRTSPETQRALFARHPRTVQQLESGENFYRILADPPSSVHHTLLRLLGQGQLARIQRHINHYLPDRHQLAALRELYRAPELLIGTYTECRQKLDRTIGHLLEADHIFEQRLHRMIMDGPRGHTARTWQHCAVGDVQQAVHRSFGATALLEGVRVDDGFSILVPANDVVAFGIFRGLGRASGGSSLPIYYVHQGLGSKTYRMADFIPYRVEGEFTYRELLDATRWVTCREFNLPRRPFERLIREDMIDSITYAIANDELAAELILPTLRRGRRLSPTSNLIPERLREILPLRALPDNFPEAFRFVVPRLSATEAFLEAQQEAERLLTAASRVRTSQ